MRTICQVFMLLLVAGSINGAENKPDLVAPPVVLALADDWMAKLPAQTNTVYNRQLRRDFVRAFFDELVHRSSSRQFLAPQVAGSRAARDYRGSNPERLKELMEGFGYTAIETNGTWLGGFERSAFVTTNHAGRAWWIWPFPITESGEWTAQDRPGAEGQVRVTGFLSPKGNYGHLGKYDHELFLTKISPPDTGQPGGAVNQSQPVGSPTNQTSATAGSGR